MEKAQNKKKRAPSATPHGKGNSSRKQNQKPHRISNRDKPLILSPKQQTDQAAMIPVVLRMQEAMKSDLGISGIPGHNCPYLNPRVFQEDKKQHCRYCPWCSYMMFGSSKPVDWKEEDCHEHCSFEIARYLPREQQAAIINRFAAAFTNRTNWPFFNQFCRKHVPALIPENMLRDWQKRVFMGEFNVDGTPAPTPGVNWLMNSFTKDMGSDVYQMEYYLDPETKSMLSAQALERAEDTTKAALPLLWKYWDNKYLIATIYEFYQQDLLVETNIGPIPFFRNNTKRVAGAQGLSYNEFLALWIDHLLSENRTIILLAAYFQTGICTLHGTPTKVNGGWIEFDELHVEYPYAHCNGDGHGIDRNVRLLLHGAKLEEGRFIILEVKIKPKISWANGRPRLFIQADTI